MYRTLVILAILGSSVPSAAAWGEETARGPAGAPSVQAILKQLDSPRGLCAVLGDRQAERAIQIARASELQVYLQLAEAKDVEAARRAADAAGMLNRRVYADKGSESRINLADNLADAVVVCGTPRWPWTLARANLFGDTNCPRGRSAGAWPLTARAGYC